MILFLLIAPLLVACASPAPEFSGAERRDITVDNIAFTVFRKGNEAEVIRRSGYLMPAERARAFPLFPRAAELATGCTAVPNSLRSRIPGDSGEARIALRCPDG